jgi:hypothetical protein
MAVDWPALISHFSPPAPSTTEVEEASLKHGGSSVGYFAESRPDWASAILDVGGPVQMMWDSFGPESIERALLFGSVGENWLAVRPNKRLSDGRPVTEIWCWIAPDPLLVLNSCFPGLSTERSESSSVGFHTNQQGDVHLGPEASVSDAIQCWAMTLGTARNQTGIASFCDPMVARQFVSNQRWITASSATPEGRAPGEPHPDDTLAGFERSSTILDRSLLLQSMEAISLSTQESIANLLYLHQESHGAPRYTTFPRSERIRALLRLGDREGAFSEFVTYPLDSESTSSWTGLVEGKLPFTVVEMKRISEHPDVEIWTFIRNLLGCECQGDERRTVIELLNSSIMDQGAIQSFLELCPDYMADSPSATEIGSMSSISGLDDGIPPYSLIRVCRLLNSNQPGGNVGSRHIEGRSKQILGMVPDNYYSEGGAIRLEEILSSQDLFHEISLDRNRIGPFLRKGFIEFHDRTRWVPDLTPSEFLEIHRAGLTPESETIREISESPNGLDGIGEKWGKPSAIPSSVEPNSVSNEIERIALVARLLQEPRISERVSFRMPLILASIATSFAIIAVTVAAWTIAGETLAPLSELSHLVLGTLLPSVSLATSILAFRSSVARRSRKRDILDQLGGE